MNTLESKKAINFDLYDALLKKYYPSKNYKKGWTDIRKFLNQNSFKHRQYSGYVLSNPRVCQEKCVSNLNITKK